MKITMFAVITEPFTHSTTRERSKILERSSLRGRGGNNDSVFHGIVLFKSLDELRNSGTFLANSNVNTVELLDFVVTIVPPLLVKDGVNGHGGLAGLTVTNDKFTLTTTNGNHGINGLETSHHRLVDGATGQDTGSLNGSTTTFRRFNRTFAVNRVTKSVDNTTKKTRADGNIDNLTGTLDGIAFLDETIVTEDGDTDIVGFQVQAHSTDTRGELHHLFGCGVEERILVRRSMSGNCTRKLTLNVLQTPDTANTITDTLTSSESHSRMQDQEHLLRTRPVSSTLLPTAVPEMRDSRMEETSEAAVWTTNEKVEVITRVC